MDREREFRQLPRKGMHRRSGAWLPCQHACAAVCKCSSLLGSARRSGGGSARAAGDGTAGEHECSLAARPALCELAVVRRAVRVPDLQSVRL
eukprot:6192974-Pleurochrysis_carterae.AAC.4